MPQTNALLLEVSTSSSTQLLFELIAVLLGILDLRTVVTARVPKEAPGNVIEIVTTSRQWYLACDTEQEAQVLLLFPHHASNAFANSSTFQLYSPVLGMDETHESSRGNE